MRSTPIVALLATAVCATARPADDPLASTFAKMDAAAAAFKGLTADVKKVSHTEAFGADDVQSGTLTVRRANPRELRALINITAPDEKQVELNGHSGQVYYPKTKTVQILNMDRKTNTMVDELLLLGFGSSSRNMETAYNIEFGGPETIDGQKTARLILKAKKPEKLPDIVSIELWISDSSGMAVQQKFHEHGGDYVLAVFTNMKPALNLPDSAVKLNLPKDVHKEVLR